MFERGDEQYLIRALNRNQVNLFLGAGFSTLAKNRLGKYLPTGSQFAESLWGFLGYKSPYDPSSSLAELYEALLASGKPLDVISAFLADHLLGVDVPPEYEEIIKVFWSRIYTTNIDNLLETVYSRVGSPRLDVRSFPKDELPDRDVTLDKIQAVYLHGHLPCSPHDVTFSISQFARRATPYDHLYDHFVRDYATKTTIFVGTALNEPLLWQYIEIRKAKRAELHEERPKSFLICPSVTEPKRQLLRAMNVVPVIGSTKDFLDWLGRKSADLADKDDVLKVTIPGLVELLASARSGQERDLRAVKEFGHLFHSVPTEMEASRRDRSLYLLGASPKWEDLLSNKDAPRDITPSIQEAIESLLLTEPSTSAMFSLLGSAGSGKSTVLRRLAIQLARAGHSCFLTNSEELARPDDIARALASIGKKAVLLFDNAETVLPALPRLLEAIRKLEIPPICVVASRVNEFERVSPKIPNEVKTREFLLPHLSRTEIRAVLTVLERENLLGQLSGMSQDQRIAEFESKANQQLLVAMREATSGRGFNDIIIDEYNTLVPQEAQNLYLCVALATASGYRLTLQEFVGCSRLPAADTLSILQRNLRDIVLRTGVNDDLLMLRHRRIAEHMIDRAAPRAQVADAYVSLLGVLASEIGASPRRSRTFSLFRSLIQHHMLFKRFGENFERARMLYDSLLPKFNKNPQFLLQYGSLEMEAGNLDIAQNYLHQADSLDPGNAYIANAKGQLLFKQAIKAGNKAAAIALRDEGTAILMSNMTNPELDDAYCYHIYCTLRLAWVRVWSADRKEKIKELEALRSLAEQAFKKYSRDMRINEVKTEIDRDYFAIVVH